jgi:DNA-binding MarR family transcriptional regulator
MDAATKAEWTFLSNHAHVLIYIARFPEARIRDIAEAVQITERFAQKVVKDLVDAGYLSSSRQGRRNTYSVEQGRNFRHPLEKGVEISRLLEIFKND